jgi:hypothetical protein
MAMPRVKPASVNIVDLLVPAPWPSQARLATPRTGSSVCRRRAIVKRRRCSTLSAPRNGEEIAAPPD